MGALHHVMVRGIERRAIFMDDLDRARFLLRLEVALRLAGTTCFAWALMPNHVHLFVRTGPKPLALAMHNLGTSYAMDFNRRHGRVGHLFQNRYKALAVESDGYLLEVIRYIHLNPVRAGILPDVASLEDYPWTGHGVLMGRRAARFQSVEEVLALMGRSPAEARSRLQSWMSAPLPADPRVPPGGGKGKTGRMGCAAEDPHPAAVSAAGSPEEGESQEEEPKAERTPRWIRANTLRNEGWNLARLTRFVCGAMGVSAEELAEGRRSRPASRARAVIAWFAWSDLALSQEALSGPLGVSANALSARMEFGRRTAEAMGIDPFREILRNPTPAESLRNELSTEK